MEGIGNDVWRMLQMSSWAQDGHLPVAGGVLDQTVSFLAAHREIVAEQNRINVAKLKR